MLYLQTAIDGIMLGGVYGTIAMGLSLAYGVMGIVNWAHGEMLMVSMYISYFLVVAFGLDPYLTIIVNMTVMFALGYILQKTTFNSLLKSGNHDSVLLSTAGLGMILSNLATMFLTSNARMAHTAYEGKTFWINDAIMISVPKLISFIIAIVVTAALYYFLQHTEMGRALRATSQNRTVAGLMGIKVNRIYCIAFGISLAMVGIAATLLIPNYSVYPSIGNNYINTAFVIVVMGGTGNIPGALLSGIIIGLVERFGAIFLSESYGTMLTFVIFVIVLLFCPTGLFSKFKFKRMLSRGTDK